MSLGNAVEPISEPVYEASLVEAVQLSERRDSSDLMPVQRTYLCWFSVIM